MIQILRGKQTHKRPRIELGPELTNDPYSPILCLS